MIIYRRRWQYWTPSEASRWWLPQIWRGSDEYGNPSLVFVLPPFGALVVFYGRGFQVERYWCDPCGKATDNRTEGDEIACVQCGAFQAFTDEGLEREG